MAAAAAGCGEAVPERGRAARATPAPTAPAAPAALPGERGRMEGTWRLTVTMSDPADRIEVRWKVKPSCRRGPCGGRIRSSSSAVLVLEESGGEGDYLATTEFSSPCVDEKERVIAENGYLVHRTDTLTVTEAVTTARGKMAVEVMGFSETVGTPVEGVDPSCKAMTTYEDLRAVRVDRPEPG
jgi:hypothetical protein